MSMIEMIKNKARSKTMKIVLPEGDETRTIQAARAIIDDGLAHPWVILTRSARLLTRPEPTSAISK